MIITSEDWEPLDGAEGAATVGVWRVRARVGLAERDGGIGRLDPDHGDREALALARAAWDRRSAVLDHLDELPQVLSHGDALPRNLLRHDGPIVTAIDWDQVGYGPIGADLATFGLWADSPAESLLDAYTAGAAADHRAVAEVGLACATSMIAISRAIRAAETEQSGSSGRAGPYRARLDRSVRSMITTLELVS